MKASDRGSVFAKGDREESSIMTKGVPGGFAGFDSEVQGFISKKDREESSVMQKGGRNDFSSVTEQEGRGTLFEKGNQDSHVGRNSDGSESEMVKGGDRNFSGFDDDEMKKGSIYNKA